VPDFEIGGGIGSALILALFAVGVVLLVVFGTTLTSALLGAVLLAAVLLVIYYVGVRVDQWARGGGTGGGTSRRDY
jgi:hypothetical protein